MAPTARSGRRLNGRASGVRRRRLVPTSTAVGVLLSLAAACGAGGSPATPASNTAEPVDRTTAESLHTPGPDARPPGSNAPAGTASSPLPASDPSPPSSQSPPSPITTATSVRGGDTLVDDIDAVQEASQVLTVTTLAGDVRSPAATFRAFERHDDEWRQVFTDIPAHIGYGGFATDKHEGDHRSPVGVFGLPFAFGGEPDPGAGVEYRQLVPGDCWGGMGEPATYNRFVHRGNCNTAGGDEDLFATGRNAYRFAALIDYNYDSPVLGAGSAIFLHVDTGSATEGCVAIPEARLIDILRWLRPEAVLVMGPDDIVRGL